MRRFTQSLLAICICPSVFMAGAANASLVEKAEQWLNNYSDSDDTFSLTLTKNRIKFKGCKQKQYQLAFSQKITPMFNVEAIVHYNKGLLEYGVLSQRVRSHEFEVVSWWDSGDYRVGLSHKVRPRHELSIPVTDRIQLPTSTSAGVYLEIPFKEDTHLLTLGAVRESWESDGASQEIAWRASRDSQVRVQYAITF
ncbi:hypothetical protein [Alteromonas gracilis]|uniref:hypothetical protein n=1 Tax=Alteromonas gracilis TaxID=1479524 RepID=UPI003736C087